MTASVPFASDTHPKKRIAVYYPVFAGGGAEAVGLWILEALKAKYDLTLFTVTDIDFDRLNLMYGTQLSPQAVTVKTISPSWLRSFLLFLIANNNDFRLFFFHKLIKELKACVNEYDLAISAYNAIDLGKKGIQYVHWIKVLDSQRYEKVSNFSQDQMKSNIFLANSEFVATAIKEKYGQESHVVYPPVLSEIPHITWEQKEKAFLCSGRLTSSKAPHRVIRILSQVRQKGFDIKLYLTGGGGGVYGWQYQRFLNKVVRENADWVTLHRNLSYKDYLDVVAKCRYGIHFKQEPFGISIAEMVKGGAIPFVKNKGGQIEIVGPENEALFFSNEDEAVAKIVSLLQDEEKQVKIRTSLAQRQALFSTEKFMSDIQKAVESFFAQVS